MSHQPPPCCNPDTQILGHAPVLGLVLPRVLTVAAWLAAVGAVLDKREAEKKSAT